MNRLIYLLILIFPFITNAQVVTNGLVLHVDANDPNSYSGSGNTWTDLTGNSNNIILNGPTFKSTNETVEKYFEFDGTDDRGAIENLHYGSNYSLTEFSDTMNGITVASVIKIIQFLRSINVRYNSIRVSYYY